MTWLNKTSAYFVLLGYRKSYNYYGRKNMYEIKSRVQISFNILIAGADKWNVHNIANAAWKWEKFIRGLNAPEPDRQEKASLAHLYLEMIQGSSPQLWLLLLLSGSWCFLSHNIVYICNLCTHLAYLRVFISFCWNGHSSSTSNYWNYLWQEESGTLKMMDWLEFPEVVGEH